MCNVNFIYCLFYNSEILILRFLRPFYGTPPSEIYRGQPGLCNRGAITGRNYRPSEAEEPQICVIYIYIHIYHSCGGLYSMASLTSYFHVLCAIYFSSFSLPVPYVYIFFGHLLFATLFKCAYHINLLRMTVLTSDISTSVPFLFQLIWIFQPHFNRHNNSPNYYGMQFEISKCACSLSRSHLHKRY